MQKIWFAAALLSLGAAGCGPHQGHGGGDAGIGGGPDLSVGDLGAGGDLAGPLTIAPADQVVTYSPGGALPTVQYTASINGSSVAPAWTIDRGEIGGIGVGNGLFTAGGTIAGTAHVTATYLGQTATTTVTVKIQQSQNGNPDNRPATPGPGGYGGVGGDGPAPAASAGEVGTLSGTPTPDPGVKILYPYDGTVWPRGLLAPSIQWNPGSHTAIEAVMIKLHEKNFDYTGTFGRQPGVTNMINAPIPQDVWHALTYSNGGAGDDVAVTIILAEGTTAIGPYSLTWHVAPGTLKGTVYYNSYGTGLVKNSIEKSSTGDQFGAATLAIKPGATDPVVVAGTDSALGTGTGCRVCHSVSANGSTLITQHGDDYNVSSLFPLTMGSTDTPVAGTGHNFPALAPDGTWFLSSSGGMIDTDATTQAYAAAGTLLSPQPGGLPADFHAALPVFSPDGKHVSYDNWTTSGGSLVDGKTLYVIDYDPTAKMFSNAHSLYTAAAGTISWSSFLPTNDAIVFEDELTSGSNEYGFTWHTGQGQLYWIDLATKTAHTLDMLNGTGYLPDYPAHTGAADAKLNYEPTVNPVVSGGYAWVVFTSRRLYGNVATIDAYTSDPRNYDWHNQITPKKLWVAAIDLNAPAGTDPSHPAFYLPGQELHAGNSRGFWTVDPCHPDGTGCETGDECCGGYCRPGGDGGALICTNQQPSCSQEYEKCMQTSDCCGAAQGVMCINGICGKTAPIP